MTIVLQFQYWDLKVTETGFEVGLSFSDVPEKLEVPFAAVRGFYDPSVNFELEFDVKPEVAALRRPSRRRRRSPRLPRHEGPGTRRQEGRAARQGRAGGEKTGDRAGRQRPEGRRRRFARRFPQEVEPAWPKSSIFGVARKRKARADAETAADGNRAQFGRSKAEKQRDSETRSGRAASSMVTAATVPTASEQHRQAVGHDQGAPHQPVARAAVLRPSGRHRRPSEHSAGSADRRGRRDAAKGCEPLFGAARIRARGSDAPGIAARRSRERTAAASDSHCSYRAGDRPCARSACRPLSFPVASEIRRAQADRSGGPSRHWLAERPAPRAIACF